MFIYGILKSLRLGYISGKKYERVASSAYDLMVDTFAVSSKSDNILNLDWTVQTGSLSSNGTFEVCFTLFFFWDGTGAARVNEEIGVWRI